MNELMALQDLLCDGDIQLPALTCSGNWVVQQETVWSFDDFATVGNAVFMVLVIAICFRLILKFLR